MRITPGRIVDTPKPTFAETVVIVLSSVTVVLAVLAIIVAILAVWGYQNIKTEAAGAADRAVKATVEAVVSKHANDDRLQALFRKEIKRMFGESAAYALKYTEAFSEDGTHADGQQGTVGADYPKGDANDGQAG